MADMEAAFRAIRSHWKSAIEMGVTEKKDFDAKSDECMRFFDGPYDFMYDLMRHQGGEFVFTGKSRRPRPSIAMTVNKVAEGVQLFGPTLYHRNPVRTVTPREIPELPLEIFGDPNDPYAQAMMAPMLQEMNQAMMVDYVRAKLMQSLLVWLPDAMNLKEESRITIDEGIIRGMGCMWHEIYTCPGSGYKLPHSSFDTVKNLILDPDATQIKDCKWVARRMVKPVWEWEKDYGLETGTLRGNYDSHAGVAASSVTQSERDHNKKAGKTNDLLVGWKIWSKMGLGGLLRGIVPEASEVDQFGQYVHLVICDNANWPINLPPTIWNNQDEMYRRAQWETPFWADGGVKDSWPFTSLVFHRKPGQLWPMGHFEPALGELQFINWTYSFLISKIEKTCRDFIAGPKGLEEEIVSKIMEGDDYTYLAISQQMGVPPDKIVEFIQHPQLNPDIINILKLVEANFEKRTGLNELIYGETAHQYRSAEEAQVKQQNLNIRPDDMANKVEEMMTDVARKEAMMARWHMDGNDISRIYGPMIGNLWTQYVATADPYEIVDSLEYRVEAGSTRKPNKDKEIQNMQQALQTFMPFFSQVAMTTGQVEPVNELITMWGEASGKDTSRMMIQPPPPMPVPGEEGQPEGEPEGQPNGQPSNGQPIPAGV
jgi:hypothetical protein